MQTTQVDAQDQPSPSTRLAWPVPVFLISMLIPWQIYIGSLHLSVSRLFLLIMVIPCLFMWMRGKAGKIRFFDIAIILYWAWSAVAIVAVHGMDYALQSAGMLFIETLGSYFLARCYIRTQGDFYNLCKMMFWVVLVLLPFAVVEAVTINATLIKLFAAVYQSYAPHGPEIRWGMKRVQGPFQHPILFGVFCGVAFALTILVLGYGRSLFRRLLTGLPVALTAILSLSTGPMSALGVQIALILWNAVLKGFEWRWKLLWGGFAFAFVALSIVSKQPPIVHFINLFAFDKGSAWQRLFIWEYGTLSVWKHPLFGIGFSDNWERPDWQTASMDMFWIIPAVRHGIISVAMFSLAWLGIFFSVVMKRGLSVQQSEYRMGYLIVMGGFFVAGWTVDFWAELYTTFLFVAASGAWFLDASGGPEGSARTTGKRRPQGRPRRQSAPVRRSGQAAEAEGGGR